MERIVETVVNAVDAGKRLDVYLSERFTYRSRNQWQAEIRAERIKIDGAFPRSSRKLRAGEKITHSTDSPEPPVDPSFRIVHEDDDILVVDKSSNLPCHPAGAYFNNTLWGALRKIRGDLNFVTRLDRETSGLTLIAKSAETAAKFAESLELNLIRLKKYLCLVFGDFPEELVAEGYLSERGDEIADGLVRKKRFFTETAPAVRPSEPARTLFKKIKGSAIPKTGNPISLLEAELDTGRTHQIRATLCSLGFPVVGDKLYGPDESIFIRFIEDGMTDEDRGKLLLPSQALHASRLLLTHPRTGEDMLFEVPPPEFWNALERK